MPDRKTLEALLVRVEGAGGEDRELDLAIHQALEPEQYPDRWSWDEARPPYLTSSIDAAVALLGRVLPGWWWSAGHCTLTDDAFVAPAGASVIGLPAAVSAHITPDHRASPEMLALLRRRPDLDAGFDVGRVGGNVPLAILAALLMALMQTPDENV